ncbi:kynurenine 3-monooxygenase, partial [Trichonephila clavata]
MKDPKDLQVVIIGGGLVGSLCACMLGNKGIQVKVYERRDDIRKSAVCQGRRMNVVLSQRGISGLRLVGIKMKPLKNRKGRHHYSANRKDMNEILLTAAEKNPNIEIFFKHKYLSSCFKTGKYEIQGPDGELIEGTADLLIGCDGAYSSIRQQMLKMPLFDYNQTYFKDGYIELCFPTTETGQFCMEGDYLHFWPRDIGMMTALPNTNCTYTVALFMPFEIFEQTNTPEKLIQLFQENFPDAIPLFGEEKLINDFFNVSANPMVTIKCNSYHVNDKVLIIGDAAHAMLPFGGQGMNAGFEDCEILSELLTTYKYDLREVLPAFSKIRHKDAEVACDLSKSIYTI